MSINYLAVAKDLATWSHAAVAVIGAFAHKLYSVWVGAEAKFKAELAKLEADAKAVEKKL